MHLVLKTDDSPHLPMSSCFLATGRSCIMHMIGRYSPTTVFMPWMVPEGLVQPFERVGVDVKHYALNPDLSPNIPDVEKAVEAVQPERPLIVVIHYFGLLMPTRECAVIAHEHRGLLLEDCAHCLTSPDTNKMTCGDLSLFSMNKILPVPDGGMMFSKSAECVLDIKSSTLPKLDDAAICAYREHLSACRILAVSPKADKWFQMAEKQADKAYETYYEHISTHLGPCRPSDQTVNTIRDADFEAIVVARRKNAEIIANRLTDKQRVHPGLPIMTVPMLAEDRDALADKLLELGIQTNILSDHWRAPPADQDPYASWFWKNHLHLPLNEHMTVTEAIHIGNAVLHESGGGDPGENGEPANAGQESQAI